LNSIIKGTTILCIFLFSISTIAEDTYSFGVGMGTSYGGFGVNISQLSETDMKYLSTGCMSYSSLLGSACGAGIGWIKTDLFSAESSKHGLGAYLGIVGSERVRRNSSYDNDPAYGAGIGYHYFFRGIKNPGANIGVSLVAGGKGDGIGKALIFEFGYQF